MLLFRKNKSEEFQWVSISDLMSVLMMIFLFIAISYIQSVQSVQKKIESIVVTYENLQNDLYNALLTEFSKDLKKWNAEIIKETLSVKFKEPSVLFDAGSYQLKNDFKQILNDFFPRYIKILYQDNFKDNISEIRIEGHTSSEWIGVTDKTESYFLNMELSQDRTRSVLNYCLSLMSNRQEVNWVLENTTANGLSFSKPVLNYSGEEDKLMSRRVEFRTRTNAERKIVQIIKTLE